MRGAGWKLAVVAFAAAVIVGAAGAIAASASSGSGDYVARPIGIKGPAVSSLA
jgi:hypothetical protein